MSYTLSAMAAGVISKTGCAQIAWYIGRATHGRSHAGDKGGKAMAHENASCCGCASASRRASTVAVGGHFDLTNHLERPVSDATYRGRYRPVFFGFPPTAINSLIWPTRWGLRTIIVSPALHAFSRPPSRS